jgi:hypothetical protein
MANTADICTTLGDRLMLRMDPTSSSWTQPASVDLTKLSDIAITASGGEVEVVEVRNPNKYPFADLATNQCFLKLKLSRPILFGETVTVTIPASLVSDGTRTNATSTDLAVTNYSYAAEGVNPNALLSDTARIVYVDPTGGDDTLAAAVNSGDGYYVKADVGDNAAEPDIAVQAYATWLAAFQNARASTSGSTLARHACVLIKRGEVIDGTDDYLDTSRVFGATGGIAHETPFVVGQYGTTGINPEILGESSVGLGANSAMAVSGTGATSSFVVVLGVNMAKGTNERCLSFASNSGQTRQNYYFKRCRFIGEVYLGITGVNTSFRQLRTGFDYCVFDGDNEATNNGGIFSTNANWNDSSYRGLDIRNSMLTNASGGGQRHGLYIKEIGDVDIESTFYYDIGGTPNKLDSCWGVDISDCVFLQVNNLGNSEANGESTAGLPDDRARDTQTTEYPLSANSNGCFSKWHNWRRNIITDALLLGDRGSPFTGFIGNMGPSQAVTVEDCVGVLATGSTSVGFIHADDGGSSNGYLKDTWDFIGRRNTLIMSGSSGDARSIQFNPPDDDNFAISGTNQVGMHNVQMYNNVFYIGSSRTNPVLFRFGVVTDDETYGESFTAGRTQGDWNYNCFYSGAGYTDAFSNGDPATDTFSSLAAFVVDMNSVDTSMTGNRSEDPSIVDPDYQISDYLVDGLGYASLSAAMSVIYDAILTGEIPETLTTAAIAAAVLPNYVNSLSESDYNNEPIGFVSWAGEPVIPTPTLGISVLSPEDGAEGISDEVSPLLIFNKLAAGVSGKSIELRRISDNSVISSMDAGDVPVTGTLARFTGIRAKGIAEEVYMYLEAGSFVGLDGSTFAGVTTNGGWNFSIGAIMETPESRIRDADLVFDLRIANGANSGTNYKGVATLPLSTATSGSAADRVLLRFRRPSALRAGDVVTAADLTLNFATAAGATAMPLVFGAIRRSDRLTDDVTWDEVDGEVEWVTPGGDFSAESGSISTDDAPADTGDTTFNVVRAVEKALALNPNSEYIDLIVKHTDEATTFTLSINGYADDGTAPDAEAPRLSIEFASGQTDTPVVSNRVGTGGLLNFSRGARPASVLRGR